MRWLDKLADLLFGRPSFSPVVGKEEFEQIRREQDRRAKRVREEAKVWLRRV